MNAEIEMDVETIAMVTLKNFTLFRQQERIFKMTQTHSPTYSWSSVSYDTSPIEKYIETEIFKSFQIGTSAMFKKHSTPKITEVIFRNPLTLVRWSDGTETKVTCHNEEWDEEKGLAMGIVKKFMGNYTDFNTALEGAFRDNRLSRKQKKFLLSDESVG